MIHAVQTVQAEPKTDEAVGDLPRSLIRVAHSACRGDLQSASVKWHYAISQNIVRKTSFAKHSLGNDHPADHSRTHLNPSG
jgi:hypothetical protein